VHYPQTVAWRDETLARRPGREGEPAVKTLIELPTFAILAPSYGPTHPTGRPYVRLFGGFETIPAVTAEEHADLVVLARTFDAMPRPSRATRRGSTS
jgi:putative DNA primase/helicase